MTELEFSIVWGLHTERLFTGEDLKEGTRRLLFLLDKNYVSSLGFGIELGESGLLLLKLEKRFNS